MLTSAQLFVLITYQWDARLFAAQASAAEKVLMQTVDWNRLAELLADLRLYHQGLVSKEYAQKIHTDLLAACADEETAQTFIGYASTV